MDDAVIIQLAPLLYSAFVESEQQHLVGTPLWQDLTPETMARWIRMATLLENRIQTLRGGARVQV